MHPSNYGKETKPSKYGCSPGDDMRQISTKYSILIDQVRCYWMAKLSCTSEYVEQLEAWSVLVREYIADKYSFHESYVIDREKNRITIYY